MGDLHGEGMFLIKKRVQEFISHVAGNRNWNDRKKVFVLTYAYLRIFVKDTTSKLFTRGHSKVKKINSDMDPEILFELLELIEPFELFQPFRAFKPFGVTLGKWHNFPVQMACRQEVGHNRKIVHNTNDGHQSIFNYFCRIYENKFWQWNCL